MKIIIGVHHFPPRYTGGAEQRALRTATALQSRGHQVKVVCIEHVDQGPAQGLAWQDETYQNIPVRRLSFDLSVIPDRALFEYNNLWIGEHLEQLLQNESPDIFHLIGGYLLTGSSLRAAQRVGIRTLVTLTDFWFICPRITLLRSDGKLSSLPIDPATCARCLAETSRRYRLPAKLAPGLMDAYWRTQTGKVKAIQARLDFLKDTLNSVDHIIYPSKFLGEVFAKEGIDPERSIFSRQGHNFPELTDEKLIKTPSKILRLAYMGQIVELKGVHVLLEAIKQIPGAPLQLTLYGDTTPFPKYTESLKQIASGDSRIIFAGTYKRQDLSRVLQDVDIVVMPSLWYENSPNTILEAFAHRTPVIASKLGGMAELVQHDVNGLLFPPGNAEALAEILQRLAGDPSLVQSLHSGIPQVKSQSQEINELEALYVQITHP